MPTDRTFGPYDIWLYNKALRVGRNGYRASDTLQRSSVGQCHQACGDKREKRDIHNRPPVFKGIEGT
jgi:hypothetical protein